MKKIEISKLYNFLLDDIDKNIMKSNKYQKARKKVHIKEDELREFIGNDGFKKQEEFMDEYIGLNHIAEEEIFIYAFSLANKLRDELEEKLENVVYVQVDDVVGMMNEVASKYYDEVSLSKIETKNKKSRLQIKLNH